MIRAGIIGVTGYAGIELLRLLHQHPAVSVTKVFTESYAGQEIATIYPHLKGLMALRGEKLDLNLVKKNCDMVFISLPHSHASQISQPLLDAGIQIIDLGADFRLKNSTLYQEWYQEAPASEALLKEAVYGLPETGNREIIKNACLIANPGCYPTAALLATIPALASGIIDPHEYIFDAKSGISGSGRTLSLNNHHCEVTENLLPYQITKHRHTPEIEQELSALFGSPITIQFTPHLVPMIRGLLVTAYFKLNGPVTANEVHTIYETYYQNAAFIRILPLNAVPQIKHVRGTNYCDISIHMDHRTQRLIIVSVIDNLIKGAAGQAIQNMNLMQHLPETMGLNHLYANYP